MGGEPLETVLGDSRRIARLVKVAGGVAATLSNSGAESSALQRVARVLEGVQDQLPDGTALFANDRSPVAVLSHAGPACFAPAGNLTGRGQPRDREEFSRSDPGDHPPGPRRREQPERVVALLSAGMAAFFHPS